MDKNKAYEYSYHKFKTMLVLTKANTLNHDGQLTLIQSIFASISLHYMASILFSEKFLARTITTIIPLPGGKGFRTTKRSPAIKDHMTPFANRIKGGGLGIRTRTG
jgi:hypothetical protein